MLMRRCDFQVPFFQDILKTSKTCLGFAICTLWAARMSHTNGTFISNAKMLEMSPKLNANFYGQSCLNRQSHKKAKPESAVEITTKKDTRLECVLNIKSENFDQRHAFSGSPRYSKNFLKMKKISTTNARLADWPQSFTT